MSARSHLGHAVYRNHPVHDVYIERIERGESPVEEVFRFDEDDRRDAVRGALARRRKTARRTPNTKPRSAAPSTTTSATCSIVCAPAGSSTTTVPSLVLTDRGKLVYDLVTLAFYPKRAREWLAAHESGAAFVSQTPSLAT